MHSVNVPRGPGMGMLSQLSTHVTKQAFLRQRHFCLFSLSLAQTTKPQLASRDGPVAAGLATTTSPVGFDSGRTAWAGIFEARSFDCKDISIFPPPPKKLCRRSGGQVGQNKKRHRPWLPSSTQQQQPLTHDELLTHLHGRE